MSSKKYVRSNINHFGSDQEEQIEAEYQRKQREHRERFLRARRKDLELGVFVGFC